MDSDDYSLKWYGTFPEPVFPRKVYRGRQALYVCTKCYLPRPLEFYAIGSRKDYNHPERPRIPTRANICRYCDNADSQVTRQRNKHGLPYTYVFPYKEWGRMVDACNDTCPACQSPNAFITLDHIIPLSRGGRLELSNMRPICKPCNSRKRDRMEVA